MLVGSWWPEAPANRAAGRLTYDPVDGLRIDLDTSGHILPITEATPIILGETVDGRPVTLIDVLPRDARVYFPRGSTSWGRVHRAIIGAHADSEAGLRLHSLRARVTSLTEWAHEPAFDISRAERHQGTIDYAVPSPVALLRANGRMLSLESDLVRSPDRGTSATAVSLEQRTWVKAQGKHRRSLRELLDDIERFVAFLSFSAGRDCPFLELSGEMTIAEVEYADRPRYYQRRVPVWILFERTIKGTGPTEAKDMLIRLAELDRTKTNPLTRWYRQSELLRPVYNLYLSAIPTQSPRIEFRFLALAQALDALYHRTHERRAPFVGVVGQVVDELPSVLKKRVPPRFVPLVKDTRHYFTHWNAKYERKAAKGMDLVSLTYGARVLVEMMLLRRLGLSQTELAQVVQNNQRVIRSIRLSFDRLSETPTEAD